MCEHFSCEYPSLADIQSCKKKEAKLNEKKSLWLDDFTAKNNIVAYAENTTKHDLIKYLDTKA
jgi:hypothetical protein